MNRNLKHVIERVRSRLVVWCVLAVVLEIITITAPLPFVQIIAWLATAYCAVLLVILLVLMIMQWHQ
ncbi:hypothetical protein [uncultured Limosilactobacillus sp.]|uniref:hypothetical protein n=1 Tax=uncultured Limosilactobacillus sp. TaxID=2837629 RepID=UPI0025F8E9F0|nr:hypothetical protein [uncultured Limosilactobacillus sp.]